MRLCFLLDCHLGIQKKHKLTYEDRACLFPAVEMASPYTLTVQPSLARAWTEHFFSMGKSGECSLHCTRLTCAMRCCVDGPLDGQRTYTYA